MLFSGQNGRNLVHDNPIEWIFKLTRDYKIKIVNEVQAGLT